MVNFTFDFSPSFKAVFYILWLGYPFLMILSGFILYLTIRHDHVFAIHSRRVSSLIFFFSTLMAISSLITVVAWLRYCILTPVILYSLIILFSIIILIFGKVKQNIVLKPIIAIIVLYIVAQAALICLYYLCNIFTVSA